MGKAKKRSLHLGINDQFAKLSRSEAVQHVVERLKKGDNDVYGLITLFGLTAEELQDPHNNVRVAAMLLEEIDSMVQLPNAISREDSLGIVLACYNGGLGHVSDARRLARAHGEDMNSWDVVSRYLALKADPAYYEQDVVSYGKFSGGKQTTAYVRTVMKRYEKYCRMAAGDEVASLR